MICLGYNGFGKAERYFRSHYGRKGRDRFRIIGHDAGAALAIDGVVVAAAEEERFTREKKTSAFPLQTIRWCLEFADVGLQDVDHFCFPWAFPDPGADGEAADGARDLYAALGSPEAIRGDFLEHLGAPLPPEKLVLVPHHEAHLLGGFRLVPADLAAFLISDGRAERMSAVMGEVSASGEVRYFDSCAVPFEHSLGMLYSKVTRYLGFTPNHDEYKVMGLGAYAREPTRNPIFDRLVGLRPGGSYEMLFDYRRLRDPEFESLLSDTCRELGVPGSFGYRAAVAWCAQDTIERVTAHQLAALRRLSRADTLLIEGGLALNCVNNAKVRGSGFFDDVRVSHHPNDSGIAVGAALAVREGALRKFPSSSPYLGPSMAPEQIARVLRDHRRTLEWRGLSREELLTEAAELLADGAIVGWCQGRLEFGPRALGNRSILANPSVPEIKDELNRRVKGREPFRPFAPAVLRSRADEVFEMLGSPRSPYMTSTYRVRPEYSATVAGACHVDGTARVQTVTRADNSLFADLLTRFEEISGVPCLINTSFNRAGEPIVASPSDAVGCFLGTAIDSLVIERYLVSRRDGLLPENGCSAEST